MGKHPHKYQDPGFPTRLYCSHNQCHSLPPAVVFMVVADCCQSLIQTILVN